MSGRTLVVMILAAVALTPSTGAAGAAGAAGPEGDSLSQVINREIRADGPFFTAPERALIERKCGYAAGQWDGFQLNISNNALICSNGRRVDDAEIRAMLSVAQPRIARRVSAAMRRPEVTAAIDLVAAQATERALRQVRARRGN